MLTERSASEIDFGRAGGRRVVADFDGGMVSSDAERTRGTIRARRSLGRLLSRSAPCRLRGSRSEDAGCTARVRLGAGL